MDLLRYIEEKLDSKKYLYGNLESFVDYIHSLSINFIDMDYLKQNFDEENHQFYFNENIINDKSLANYYKIDFISRILKITLVDIIITLIENYKEKSESEEIEFFYIDSFVLILFYNKFIEILNEESLSNKDFEKKIYVKYKSTFKKRIQFYLKTVEETIKKHTKREIDIFNHLYDVDDKCFFDMLVNFFIRYSKKDKRNKLIKIKKDTSTFNQRKDKFFKTLENDIVFLPFLNYIIDRTANDIIIKSINWEKYSRLQLSQNKNEILEYIKDICNSLNISFNLNDLLDEIINTNSKVKKKSQEPKKAITKKKIKDTKNIDVISFEELEKRFSDSSLKINKHNIQEEKDEHTEKYSILKKEEKEEKEEKKDQEINNNSETKENIMDEIYTRYNQFFTEKYEKIITNPNTKINKPETLRLENRIAKNNKKYESRDFVDYFRIRYDKMYERFITNPELKNLYSINRIKSINVGECTIIAMISDMHESKKGNTVYTLEDKTDNLKAIFSNNINKDINPNKFFLDDIYAFSGHYDRNINLFIIDKILSTKLEKKKLNSLSNSSLVCFVSDFHIGNLKTNEKDIRIFFDFLNGKTKNEKLNKLGQSIGYLFIGGDLIDSIGNYPNQDQDLKVKNIYAQVDILYDILKKTRQDLNIIIAPGNHDLAIIEEPQPILPLKYYRKLYSLKNVLFTTNPSLVEIQDDKDNKINIFYYHGASFMYYLKSDYYYSIRDENKRLKEFYSDILDKGHVSQYYGSTYQNITTDDDYMFIPDNIDIFFTSHLHKTFLDRYNNVDIINTGCWIEETEYQKLNGLKPDLNCCVISNLKTRKNLLIDFKKYKKLL